MDVENRPRRENKSPQFSLGDVVSLRSAPNSRGAIIRVVPGTPDPRYVVLIDGRTTTYYSRQLIPAVVDATSENVLSVAEFQARLTSLQLVQPSLSNLYSLHAARVNFVPYQYRPVLKFIRSDRPRLLIADEVGVGKTIEAGLILRELQARQDIRSICIICPKPLVTERKWANEMKRFDEEFTHLDGPLLRQCIAETDLEGEWPDKYARCIIPFSLFDERLLYGDQSKAGRKRVGLFDLDQPPRFDLVIVDEAHALRNPARFLHQGVNLFLDNAEAAVLLSATPIQLHSDDLFVLLNLLRPDVVFDKQTFYHMSEPNPYLHAAVTAARAATAEWRQAALASLTDAGQTTWGTAVLRGNPDYQRLCGTLGKNVIQGEVSEPTERLTFIRDVEELNAFAGIINRTRRRDIGNFTTRKPETVTVEFTLDQRSLHDALLAAQERILHRIHGDLPMKFLMTTIRRQAASCLFGLAPMIETILQRRMSELDWDEASDDEWNEVPVDDSVFRTLREEIEGVLDRARNLDPNDDPKRDALVSIALQKQSLPNNKILLFSSFRHTLSYLLKHLIAAGMRVALIQGDVPDEERVDLRNRFSLAPQDPTAIDVLLSSEVGCEGLDYQFCDTLVNYDLPWNPQKVEQRIGRIDRYGQQSETVAIYNLITPGTVDFEIFERCLSRIGVFQQALGGSEEILGTITRELHSVMENLSLTDYEREQRLQQLADNQIRRLQEQTRLEEQQAELFGILLPPQQIEQEIRDATSVWLSPAALQNLIQRYLTVVVGGEEHIQGGTTEGGGIKTLRLSQEARNRLLEGSRRLPRQNSAALHREWEKWLRGSDQRLEITFDAEAAATRRGVMFVTPIHPLAQQAARHFDAGRNGPFRTAIRVMRASFGDELGGAIPASGVYPFVVYQWQRRGIRDDAQLQFVAVDAVVTANFSMLIERGQPVDAQVDFPKEAVYHELDSRHFTVWQTALDEHRAVTEQVAAYRRESLRVTYEARANLLREKLTKSENAKIQKMQQSQLSRAEVDFVRRLEEIDSAARRADIIADAVVYGVMFVE